MNKTEIANIALAHARETSISGDIETTSTPIAETVLALYDHCLTDSLRFLKPVFARERVKLASEATPPSFGYNYQYLLPSDYVVLVQFNGDDMDTAGDYFELEGNRLLTNSSTVEAVYIKNVSDSSIYDSSFIEAFALNLAVSISASVRGDKEFVKALTERRNTAYEMAVGVRNGLVRQPNSAAKTDKTNLVNSALRLIDLETVNGNVDSSTSKEAELAIEFYDQSLRDTIRFIKPLFARKRVSITVDATAPAFGYAHRYALPSDYLQMVQFNGNNTEQMGNFFEIEGDYIHTSQDTCEIVYAYKESDVAKFDPSFREAFILNLALQMLPSREPEMDAEGKPDGAFTALYKTLSERLKFSYQKAVSQVVALTKLPNSKTKPDKTALVNDALRMARLPIVNGDVEDSVSDVAEIAREFYDSTRRRLLETVKPSFSVTLGELTVDATNPEFGKTYRFPLPVDYIKILGLVAFHDLVSVSDYEVIGAFIHTCDSYVNLKYISDVTDTTLWNSQFREAFKFDLAMQLATAKSDDPKLVNFLTAKAAETASLASFHNSSDRVELNSKERIMRGSRWTGVNRRVSTNDSSSGSSGVTYD